MASLPIRMGLAVRQVDTYLSGAIKDYPASLPLTHPAFLHGWQPRLTSVGGLLGAYTRDGFAVLPPLQKQLEVNRCHAEALLALVRAGEVQFEPDEKEHLTQRSLGILPLDEGERFLEVASVAGLSPHFLTSAPERFVKGIAEIEQEFGPATALGYGSLLLAGLRTNEDLLKYGQRIQQLFDMITNRPTVASPLRAMGKSGMTSMAHDARVRLVRALREQLWQVNPNLPGRPFLLTQVIDGYLGLRPGGVGDDLGLAVIDSIVLGKLTFAVTYLLVRGNVYLEVAASSHGFEYWDPLQRQGEVRVGSARRLGIVELLAQGYTRMARGYANAKQHAHGARVAQWVLGVQPSCAEAYQILGQCLLGEQRPREAIEMCDKALEHDFRLADAYLVRGNAYGVLSRWPEAIKCYKQAIHHRVGYAEAYNNLGLALFRNREWERAIGAYKQAVRVRLDYAEAYYNLGNLYFERAQTEPEQGALAQYDLAIDAYQHAVQLAPDFAGAHYNLGQAFYGKKDLPSALAAYQAAVKANPKHAGAWHNLGIVYRDMGHQELAVEALEKAVTLNPILLR